MIVDKKQAQTLFVIFIFGITHIFTINCLIGRFVYPVWLVKKCQKQQTTGTQKSTGNLQLVTWNKLLYRMEKRTTFGVNCWNIYWFDSKEEKKIQHDVLVSFVTFFLPSISLTCNEWQVVLRREKKDKKKQAQTRRYIFM